MGRAVSLPIFRVPGVELCADGSALAFDAGIFCAREARAAQPGMNTAECCGEQHQPGTGNPCAAGKLGFPQDCCCGGADAEQRGAPALTTVLMALLFLWCRHLLPSTGPAAAAKGTAAHKVSPAACGPQITDVDGHATGCATSVSTCTLAITIASAIGHFEHLWHESLTTHGALVAVVSGSA